MYAVIQTGGKQYKVQQGDVIYVEKLDLQAGSEINFEVLMLGGDDGVQIGNPTLASANVTGKLIGQVKGEKLVVFKYRSKKNSRKKQGHRQPYSKVEITAVG
ncbi:50S ribosomal protein L21 [Eubacteriales bacterium OttesenSCG-928-N13]|nr:50S ribosomal protein L21 [Eubacteriales bacterium OttesenSCG-928-N13]